MEKRCNGVVDSDYSFDELNCSMVLIDNYLYQKEYPPHEKDGSETKVNISVTIFSIGSFQELDMSFGIKLLIQLQWYVFFILRQLREYVI